MAIQSLRETFRDRLVLRGLLFVNLSILSSELRRRWPWDSAGEVLWDLGVMFFIINGVLGLLIWLFSNEAPVGTTDEHR